ncbi:MAG: hypothetical protein HYY19_06110 [Candidatus Rokubacteria bacterium]|nr:hypothetical protein [Candidatus Rokubacteria bacterium]
MEDHRQIRVDLIKLASGERLLRLSEAASGLSLEKKLDHGSRWCTRKNA